MSFAKKVVIAVDFTEDLPQRLKSLRKLDFLNHSELHFVHVFPTTTYPFGLGEFPLIFPMEADRDVISQSGIALLVNMTELAMAATFVGRIIPKILFSDSEKSCFTRYVEEVHADLVIVFPRRRHGFFDSSFGEYVSKHAHSDVLFIKPKETV